MLAWLSCEAVDPDSWNICAILTVAKEVRSERCGCDAVLFIAAQDARFYLTFFSFLLLPEFV